MQRIYFWMSALGVALLIAALAALLLPYGVLGMDTLADRQRGWLLTVWTAGVMGICFGGSGLLAAVAPISFRDVAEAGSVPSAIEAYREARERQGPSPFFNFAGWTASTGGFLVLIYFAGWAMIQG
jgi:hypothetical protein